MDDQPIGEEDVTPQEQIESLRLLAELPDAFKSRAATSEELHGRLDEAERLLQKGPAGEAAAIEHIRFVMRAVTPREQGGWQ